MSDEHSHPVNDPDSPAGTPDVPASVTFMEIMRQAAAKAESEQTPYAEKIPAVDRSRSTAEFAALETPPSDTAQTKEAPRREAAMEQQRILRVKKRRQRRRRQTVGMLSAMIRSFVVVLIAAGLMATIFTWWTPSQFIDDQVRAELSLAQATGQASVLPTPIPTPNWLRKIGIVSGHRGPQIPPDPGAVCPDGLTEAEINFAVATHVVRNLRGRGYSVDLLDEFDPRLDNYQAVALVSIHANTCQNFGERVSGFLIARAAARSGIGNDDLLVDCIARYYNQAVGLERRQGVTLDMTDYHTFREIHPLTPAVIIELGFLLADRDILTGKQEDVAKGITDGILCFLEPSQTPALPTPTRDAG
jgi:N-acetylmuramoyl-L-alanine amidase